MNADGTFAVAYANVIPEHAADVGLGDLSPRLAVPHYTGSRELVKIFENLPPGRYTVVAFAGRALRGRAAELGEGADQTVIVKLPAEPGPCRRQ